MYKYYKQYSNSDNWEEVTEAQTYRDLIGNVNDITYTFNQLKRGKIITTKETKYKAEEL